MSSPSTRHSFQPRRPLGRTGFVATVLGIGDVADRSVPIDQCVATVRRAIDAGLNVVDTAPGYEDGYSEQIVGRAVRESGRPREALFVIDKIDHHDEPVGPQVESSLGRLGLTHTDLFVFHGLSTRDGWARLTAPGGGMDQLEACRRAGQTRFRGISSHHPDVLREAIVSGLCDVVMFAVGPFCDRRYVERILPLTREHNVGTVCFKTFGAGKLVADTTGYGRPLQERPRGKFSSGPAPGHFALPTGVGTGGRGGGSGGVAVESALPRMPVEDCVHYTLTLDPDVALLGMSFPNEQDPAWAAAANFNPLSPERMAQIRARAAECVQGKGPSWWDPQE